MMNHGPHQLRLGWCLNLLRHSTRFCGILVCKPTRGAKKKIKESKRRNQGRLAGLCARPRNSVHCPPAVEFHCRPAAQYSQFLFWVCARSPHKTRSVSSRPNLEARRVCSHGARTCYCVDLVSLLGYNLLSQVRRKRKANRKKPEVNSHASGVERANTALL